MTPSPAAATISFLIAVLAGAPPAGAQSGLRPYAGGSVGNFSVSADAAEGKSASGGFFAGVALSKLVDAEIRAHALRPIRSHGHTPAEASRSHRPARRERTIERLSVITRFDKEREVTRASPASSSFTPAGRRVTPGFIIGVDQPARARPDDLYARVDPEGIDPQHPSVIRRIESSSRNIGGLTVARISPSPSRDTCRSSRTCATTTARSATRSTTRCARQCGCSVGSERELCGSGLRAQGSGLRQIFEYVVEGFAGALSLEP